VTQELYDGDGKKLITYPLRAEARHLTENQISDVPAIVAALTRLRGFAQLEITPPVIRRYDNGKIVGDYTDSSGVDHGFLYDNGHFTTVDDPLGTQGTDAVVGDFAVEEALCDDATVGVLLPDNLAVVVADSSGGRGEGIVEHGVLAVFVEDGVVDAVAVRVLPGDLAVGVDGIAIGPVHGEWIVDCGINITIVYHHPRIPSFSAYLFV
jgi:hypothetical protein